MKMWLVSTGYYDEWSCPEEADHDASIVGIFSTYEKALDIINDKTKNWHNTNGSLEIHESVGQYLIELKRLFSGGPTQEWYQIQEIETDVILHDIQL